MISKSTIDKVFDISRVEEVIGDYVQLKKSGSNFKGLSPFTEERSPSFMVSPVKQIWKDFSSGKGGNVVAFLMEHEHYTYPEAIKHLAKRYNIEVEETEQSSEEKEKASERESMYLVNEFAKSFFIKQMLHTDEGKSVGLSYFKKRGFTSETMEKFDLGYSPDEWQAFTDSALEKGYRLEFLEKTGLSIVKGEKRFDRFKGRVMFPIHSMSGRILGFGGRILTTDKKQAKYLNSPESDVYHKSKVLYGLYQAKQSIAKADNCYLVEGYTDVIQFNQTGIENVVASSGTALTPEQIRLINRLTNNITVLFDGDAAGLRASVRGIDLILEQGMNVKVCLFPDGEDPDSFAKSNSKEELETYLNSNAQDFIRFKASLLLEDAENDPVKKAEVVRDIVNSISKIPDQITQEIYIQSCSNLLEVSEDVLFSTLAQILAKDRKESQRRPRQGSLEIVKEKKTEPVVSKVNQQYVLERNIIQLLLKYGGDTAVFVDVDFDFDEFDKDKHTEVKREYVVFEKIFIELQEDEVEFSNPLFKELYALIIEIYTKERALKIDTFINHLKPDLSQEVTSIIMENEKNQLHDWKRQEIFVIDKSEVDPREVMETILNLRRFLIRKKVQDLSEIIREQKEEVDRELMIETMEYNGLEVLISNKLNRVL
ncbi:DNA primase DnaG [Psychroflexus torquis ATCC 700755]|uniref:DNA primase n=1 Tax=Psychroflexus torquis (strain ATCC 700755 / CIP 106069 / ACAM 623) TaxID=313595 RepID=K4IIZ7_PSYTT|nr:DNA primase [Psychroflexus torquis]AFU69808.1 DNA primase DnaG [Psychroflexus torquis ATCC 700755]